MIPEQIDHIRRAVGNLIPGWWFLEFHYGGRWIVYLHDDSSISDVLQTLRRIPRLPAKDVLFLSQLWVLFGKYQRMEE